MLLYFFTFLLLTVEYLLQCDVRIGFSEHVLLQFEFAMLDGRDGDAVDVADGKVAEAESRNHGVGSTDHFQEPAVLTMIHYSFH